MKLILVQITNALKSVVKTFFTSDLDVMSDEVREILSNPEDAEKYTNALKDIRDGEKQKTIVLSNQDRLTLIQ